MIKAVHFASWGTPFGSCGSFGADDNCAIPAERLVEQLCLGRSNCTLDSGLMVTVSSRPFPGAACARTSGMSKDRQWRLGGYDERVWEGNCPVTCHNMPQNMISLVSFLVACCLVLASRLMLCLLLPSFLHLHLLFLLSFFFQAAHLVQAHMADLWSDSKS